MKRKAKPKTFQESIMARGFMRVQITEKGKVVGDSGWKSNLITNNGYSGYLSAAIASTTGSSILRLACLGTGSTPAATDTALPGEYTPNATIYRRTAVVVDTSLSKTLRLTFSFNSTTSHIQASTTLGNVGLIASTTSGGSLMCGVGFATSQWNTNQDIQGTYQIQFA